MFGYDLDSVAERLPDHETLTYWNTAVQATFFAFAVGYVIYRVFSGKTSALIDEVGKAKAT